MITLLVSLFGPLWGKLIPWIVGLLVVLGLAWTITAHFNYVHKLEANVATLTSQRDQALQVNADNLAVFNKARAQWLDEQNQIVKARNEADKRASDLQGELNAINSAPASDDGPISNGLRASIGRMYGS